MLELGLELGRGEARVGGGAHADLGLVWVVSELE
jgi:hypothetical protein